MTWAWLALAILTFAVLYASFGSLARIAKALERLVELSEEDSPDA